MKFVNNVSETPKFIVLCDVDSTLINQEVIDELADELGIKDQVSEITESAMRGELDFQESLKRRVSLLAGLTVDAFLGIRSRITFTEGALDFIKAVHDRQGAVFAVSGGFNEVLDIIGPELELDGWKANTLGKENNVLTGAVLGSIVDGPAKAETLNMLMERFGVLKEHTMAVGDGANDIEMLQSAGIGIAFDAKPALVAVSDVAIARRDLREAIALLPDL